MYLLSSPIQNIKNLLIVLTFLCLEQALRSATPRILNAHHDHAFVWNAHAQTLPRYMKALGLGTKAKAAKCQSPQHRTERG